MTCYEKIAALIRCVDADRKKRFNLAETAGKISLSPSCLHSLLSSWTGISPADFLQCFTLPYTRELLRKGSKALDGKVSEQRTYSCCLAAATSDEVKSRGAGWTISAGYAATPLGVCLIAENPRGICHLSFVEPGEKGPPRADSASWNAMRSYWPKAKWMRNDRLADALCERIFDTEESPPFNIHVKGSAFQLRVWRMLLRVPKGYLVSYGRLAEQVGSPKASRAVGTAVGNNPVGFLIPCHRVIRKTGAIGGYRWGTIRKKAIQIRERSHSY